MAINRKKFLQSVSLVSLGLLAAPLSAYSEGFTHFAEAGELLNRKEARHLKHFFTQLQNADFPVPAKAVAGFLPVQLLKREQRRDGYLCEYLAVNGCRIVLTTVNGMRRTKMYAGA